MSEDLLAVFKERGALLEGHFLLSSGLHSPRYVQCARVLMDPPFATRLGEALGAELRPLLGGRAPGAVVAPALGGILVAHEVARALGVRALFAERVDGVMSLRRGFTLQPGERCLVVEDVITTGGSTQEVVDCVEKLGGVVVGVGSLIDRSGGTAAFDVTRAALATVNATTWPPESCPLCKTGSRAVKPGSRG